MANIMGCVISLRRKTESVTTRINQKTERSQSTVKVCDGDATVMVIYGDLDMAMVMVVMVVVGSETA